MGAGAREEQIRQPANAEPERITSRSSAAPSGLLALQRAAGNCATARWLAGCAPPGTARLSTGSNLVQRLAIYARAAPTASALPGATARTFQAQVDAGNPAAALSTVVIEMVSRGEMDSRLLQVSGAGSLWQISGSGDTGAVATFRNPFPDPADSTRLLPNPRFQVSPGLLSPGRTNALVQLHMSLLHEFRHVQQAEERVNAARTPGTASAAPRTPGYGNDPDEFDAYLSGVESSYDRMHMFEAALQAGVHWEFLAPADRPPFQSRWTAAQARAERMLGYSMAILMASAPTEVYRRQIRERDARARAAWDAAGRAIGATGPSSSGTPTGPRSPSSSSP